MYGTFYPSPALFGLETGLTLSQSSRRKTWTVTPGVGIVSGSLFVEGRSFLISEGFVANLTFEHEQSGWFGQGFGAYYGGLQRLTPDAYDFGFYLLQAGRILSNRTRLGVIYEWLRFVRLPRNAGDTSELAVLRLGLGLTNSQPAGLTGQVAVSLTHGAEDPYFVQIGLSRPFHRRVVR